MEFVQSVVVSIFSPTSIWSVVARGALWFIIAVVIILSTDTANPQSSMKNLKTNLGFVVMFLILSTGLVYLLFGFSAA